MKKLLSVIVITMCVTFPSCIYADAQLLIERLRSEGVLIPEDNLLFKNADTEKADNVPLVPAITTTAPSASVISQQQMVPVSVPRTESATSSELKQLKRKLSKTQRELQSLNKQYRALAATQSQPFAEQAEAFSDENKQLQQQLMAAEKQIAENTRRYEKQTNELSAQVDELKSKIANSMQAKSRALPDPSADARQQEKLNDRDKQIAQLTSKLVESEKQNSVLSLSIKDAEAKNVLLEQQVAKLADSSKTHSQLEAQLLDAGHVRDTLMKQRDEAHQKIVELEKAVTLASDEKTQSAKQIVALEVQNKTASAELEKFKQPAFSLKKHSSEDDRANYAFGVYYATKIRHEMKAIADAGFQYSLNALKQGMKDKLNGNLQISEEEVSKALANIDQKAAEVNDRENERNKQKSDRFVELAAKVKGADKAANGAVYQVVRKGTPPLLTEGDVIRFKLSEKISTGKVMSTAEPRVGQVGRLPDLMQQGVRRLGVGGKIKITVPWQLAYGEQGIPGVVPAGVASELTIEITGINK